MAEIDQGRRKPATLKDVALVAEVSINAVSRALRDMPDISADTKARVRAAAQQLGYRKNYAAAQLKTNRSQQIGVVISDISNPFFSKVVKGIESVCAQHDYGIILTNSDSDRINEEKCISRLIGCGVDGLLLAPCQRTVKDSERILHMIERFNLPNLLLAARYPDVDSSFVVSDDYLGGYLVAQHLYSLGHRRFGLLFSDHIVSSRIERLRGFSQYLLEQDENPDACIRMCEWTPHDLNASASAKQLINGPIDFTALFCYCDHYAASVYSAIYEAGLRIPEDISVVGYDNTPTADFLWPKLTTVDITATTMGEVAAQELLQTIASPHDYQMIRRHVTLKPWLVLRNSTCPPRDHHCDKSTDCSCGHRA